MPIVPWPAITSGSSNGCTKARLRSRAQLPARARRRRRSRRRAARTSPPRSRTACTLIGGVVCGITMTAGMPRRRAAERHALRMVAGRGADHAARGHGRGQVRDLVVGAAQLEGEHRLQVLALEQHACCRAGATAAARARAATRSPRRRRARAGSSRCSRSCRGGAGWQAVGRAEAGSRAMARSRRPPQASGVAFTVGRANTP